MTLSHGIAAAVATVTEVNQSSKIVRVNGGNLYLFYSDSASFTPPSHIRKSTDNGRTWVNLIGFFDANIINISVWYDRWTPGDTTGNLIHLVWDEISENDIWYANLNVATDSLSTPVRVFNGATAVSTVLKSISITKAKGGNLLIAGHIDGSGEGGTFRSIDGGAIWDAVTDVMEGVPDWIRLLPGNYADNQDIDAIFWDLTANEISLKVYDDSLNSWAETSIAASMVDGISYLPQMEAIVRLSDGHILLFAWNSVDLSTADLQAWDINGAASITAITNVVTNSDDCVGVTAMLDTDTNDIYVFYMGKSDGSQIGGSTLGIYYKISTDGGTTWGAEQTLFDAYLDDFRYLNSNPIQAGATFAVVWFNDDLEELLVSAYNPAGGAGGALRLVGGGLVY
jgi:hypothetical protein